jgi:Amt family ammonium transporter
MDIRMPVMNGLEATRRIRESDAGAQTRIVALTAHALEEERREILEAGCDDFIRKPYRDIEIFEALAKHLGVRFLYAEEQEPAAATEEKELDVAQLKKIPQDLIEKLREATVLLDDQHCLKVAGMISDHNHELGERLRCMVENLQYKETIRYGLPAMASWPFAVCRPGFLSLSCWTSRCRAWTVTRFAAA